MSATIKELLCLALEAKYQPRSIPQGPTSTSVEGCRVLEGSTMTLHGYLRSVYGLYLDLRSEGEAAASEIWSIFISLLKVELNDFENNFDAVFVDDKWECSVIIRENKK